MALKNYEHCCSTIQALASLGKVEGVIPLLHAPQPCSYQNQVGSMSCRPSNLLTAGTLVNKSDVIFGGEQGLKMQIINIYKKYKPKIIVVINTCIPQLIGEDLDGVIAELRQEIPELTVTYAKTGFNFPRSMVLGSDVAWGALVETFRHLDKVPGAIGIVGRAGQDAGNLAALEIPLKKAGLHTFVFPAPHIDEMEKIVQAEHLYPIHVTPYLTCKKLDEAYGTETRYLEIPAGIEGTSRFLRGIADYEQCQKLHDIVDEEERRVRPELEKIRTEFSRQKVRMLLVSGPGNEVSIGKIIAEFGVEVFIVPCMRNKFMQQEKKILEDRYGITFIETDFDTVEDLVREIKPNVVQVEFQAQVETVPHFIPTLINMLYLCEYGYDYALDLGKNFFRILHRPVYEKWHTLMKTYGGLS
jgi:nitrogenase molybdenum-iron protein alpha/beta subunit